MTKSILTVLFIITLWSLISIQFLEILNLLESTKIYTPAPPTGAKNYVFASTLNLITT